MSNYRIVEITNRGYPPFFYVQKRFLRWFWRVLAVECEVGSTDNIPKTYKSREGAEAALRAYIKEPRDTIRIYHDVEAC